MPIGAIVSRVWSGTHWHYPNVERLLAELTAARKVQLDRDTAALNPPKIPSTAKSRWVTLLRRGDEFIVECEVDGTVVAVIREHKDCNPYHSINLTLAESGEEGFVPPKRNAPPPPPSRPAPANLLINEATQRPAGT